MSDILQEVSIPVWRNSDCDAAYTQDVFPENLCAGDKAGGKDSCQVKIVFTNYILYSKISYTDTQALDLQKCKMTSSEMITHAHHLRCNICSFLILIALNHIHRVNDLCV